MKFLLAAAALVSLLVVPRTTAFSLHVPRIETSRQCASTTRLYNQGGDNEGGGDTPFDVETARKQLESLLGSGEDSKESSDKTPQLSVESLLKSQDDISLPPQPPLSTIERDRRVAEIQALQRLEDSDEGLAGLWNLFYSERGSSAQALLEQADQLMGNPSSWKDCELVLTELIEQYGVYFVEPINRLATLYFLQGKFDDSYKLCRVILQIKPWHFGALSGIIQVCINKGDREQARVYAEQRLPPIAANTGMPPFDPNGPINPQRVEWVQRMVANAKERLQEAEQTMQQQFGKPEEYYQQKIPPQNSSESKPEINDEGDAWQ